MNGATVWFAKGGLHYQFFRNADDSTRSADHQLTRLVHEEFVGGNLDAEVIGEDQTSYYCNYFLGNDSSKWVRHTPTFRSIRYKSVYAGIDLRYYFKNSHLEYDFMIAPEADPLAIWIRYEGIDSLFTGRDGELIAATDWGQITQRAASVFTQPSNRQIECSYVVEDRSFGFSVPEVSTELAVVIDPILIFSSFLGGSMNERSHDICTDWQDNVLVVGRTNSTNFPTYASFDWSSNFGWDGFLTKLTPLAGDYIYSTYIGGTGLDVATSVRSDQLGRPLVGGATESWDFPVGRAIQPQNAGTRDGFLLKLAPTGDELIFSTYFGGFQLDSLSDVGVDEDGFNYATGTAHSYDIPLKNAFNTQNAGGETAFLFKASPEGDSLIYSTYLGAAWEGVNLEVDAAHSAILAGHTQGQWFPLKNPIDSTKGKNTGAFVAKFAPSGDSLLFSTFISGDGGSKCKGLALDEDQNIYIACKVFPALGGVHYPTVNPLRDIVSGLSEGGLSIISSSGDSLIFSSTWGGYNYGSSDELRDIAVDGSGNIITVGTYSGSGFPLEDAIDSISHWSDSDVTVTKFAHHGTGVIYSTYYGGSGGNAAAAVAIDSRGNACFTGLTELDELPLVNPLDSTFEGGPDRGTDAFVAIIGDQLTDVEDEADQALPTTFVLHQNYPNPFNGETTIKFDLPRAANVSIVVYNILGEEVWTVSKRSYGAGTHTVTWDGKGNDGGEVASGVYFYSLTTPTSTFTRKMLFLK